jgi:hypothetical protein
VDHMKIYELQEGKRRYCQEFRYSESALYAIPCIVLLPVRYHPGGTDDDVELPYPDCKVAEKLCIGRPCYYLINTSICSSAVLLTFILYTSNKSVSKYLQTTSRLDVACSW